MRITTYRMELNENKCVALVKENSCNYTEVKHLGNPQDVIGMLNAVFRMDKLAEEHLYMIAVNTKNKPVGVFKVSHGSIDATVCSPREIFTRALLCGAKGIFLAHNHPSGDATPSKEDIATYRRIKDARKIMGVTLLDNFIIGDNYFSFLEQGIQ